MLAVSLSSVSLKPNYSFAVLIRGGVAIGAGVGKTTLQS